MNLSPFADYVEYFIIGTHTTIWLILLGLLLLGKRLNELTFPGEQYSVFAILFVPLIYLIGIVFDDIAHGLCLSLREQMKENLVKGKKNNRLLLDTLESSFSKRRKKGKTAHVSTDAGQVSAKDEDEFIAFWCSDLYSSYLVRMNRSRVVQSAIFNWLCLGIVFVFTWRQFTGPQPELFLYLAAAAFLLSIVSYSSWISLTERAYSFRKTACKVIRTNCKELKKGAPELPDKVW